MLELDRRLKLTKVLAFAAIVALSSCSSSGSKDRTNDSTTSTRDGKTTTTLKSSRRPLINATTTSEAGDSTTVTAGDVNLANVPAFTIDSGGIITVVERGRVLHTTKTEQPKRGKVSPDGKHLAVSQQGDAVRGATLEIIATADGKREVAFDSDAKEIYMWEWSPDSAALLATSRTTTGEASSAVYFLDGSTQAVSALHKPRGGNTHQWVTQNRITTWAECTTGSSICNGTQLVTKDRRAIYLANQYFEKRFGTFDVASGRVTALNGLGAQATGVRKQCGQYALLFRKNGFRDETFAVYDAETGKVTPVPNDVSTCPVVSSTGASMAFGIPSGPIVVDTTTGRATKIAREGVPRGFSKDETAVLLYTPSGTFRVATDGSGGKETSTLLRAHCAIGTTGKVLAATDTAVVVYDIGSDSATEVAARGAIGGECLVTNDGAWVFSKNAILEVATGKMGILVVPELSSYSLPLIWQVSYQTVRLSSSGV